VVVFPTPPLLLTSASVTAFRFFVIPFRLLRRLDPKTNN